MGLEAECLATWQGRRLKVRAHLDSSGLDLKGSCRLHLDLAEISKVESKDSILRLHTKQGVLELELGPRAQSWERTILHPRSRIEKLGIKPGSRVALDGLKEAELISELAARNCLVVKRRTRSSAEVLFLLVSTLDDLARLARAKEIISPTGTVWIVRQKGKDAPVTETEVRSAARRAGLVDVKVVAFSETQSALKLVIPLEQRPRNRTG